MALMMPSALLALLVFPGPGGACAAQPVAAAPAITSTQLLRTTTTWDGTPIVLAPGAHPEFQSVIITIAPGATTAWHLHPVNNVAYLLAGRLRVELENGVTREFRAGDSFAEVVNTWHRGGNIGQEPLKILVVYAGEAGRPIATPKPATPGQ